MRFNGIIVGTCVALVLTLGASLDLRTSVLSPKVRRQPEP